MISRILLLAALCWSVNARADLLIEPYVGAVVQGETKAKATDALGGAESSSKQDGFSAGARLGLTVLGLGFVALDAWATQGKSKMDNSSSDMQQVNATLAAGASAFGLARAYVAYGLAQATLKSDSDNTKYSGSVVKVGAGTSVIPMLSLNVEYVRPMWDKFSENGGSEQKVSDFNSRLEASYILVSASLPFYF